MDCCFCKATITLKAIGWIGKPLSVMLLFGFGSVSAHFFPSEFSGRQFTCLFSSLSLSLSPLGYASCYILLQRCGASSLKGLHCFPQTAAKLGYLFIWLLKCNCSSLKLQKGKSFALAPGAGVVTELATPFWSESVGETARGQLPYGEEIIRPGPLNFTSLFIPLFENFLLTTAFSLIPGRQERGGEEAGGELG